MEHHSKLNPPQKPSWYKSLFKHLTTDKFLFVEFVVLFAVLVISGFFGHQYIQNANKVNQPVKPVPHIVANKTSSPTPTLTSQPKTASSSSSSVPSPSTSPASVDGKQCEETLQVNAQSNSATCTIEVPAGAALTYDFYAFQTGSKTSLGSNFDLPTDVTCENSSSGCTVTWDSANEICPGPSGFCSQPTGSQTLSYNQLAKVTAQDYYFNGWRLTSFTKLTLSVPDTYSQTLSDGSQIQLTLNGFTPWSDRSSFESYQAAYSSKAGYLPNTYTLDFDYQQK